MAKLPSLRRHARSHERGKGGEKAGVHHLALPPDAQQDGASLGPTRVLDKVSGLILILDIRCWPHRRRRRAYRLILQPSMRRRTRHHQPTDKSIGSRAAEHGILLRSPLFPRKAGRANWNPARALTRPCTRIKVKHHVGFGHSSATRYWCQAPEAQVGLCGKLGVGFLEESGRPDLQYCFYATLALHMAARDQPSSFRFTRS